MKRVKSLRKKNRITIVHEGDDVIITTPPDVLPASATTLDIRCKKTEKLIARLDEQGFSVQCDRCHEVQFFSKEQIMQMWEQLDQMPGEASDKLIPIYCPNCMNNETSEQEARLSPFPGESSRCQFS